MTRLKSLKRSFKNIDFFSTNINFRENGGDSFGSVFGACISSMIALVVTLYGVNKFIIMSNYDDT